MVLFPAERTILTILGVLTVATLALVWIKDVAVAPMDYAFSAGFAAVLLLVGQFYRQVRKSEQVALMAHAVAFFVAWCAVGSLFNLMLLPRPTAPIDAALVRIDAMLGYSWPAICAWVARYPLLADLLRGIYLLTLIQLLFVFLFLGLSLDRERLHSASLAMVFGSLLTIISWALMPSSGASAYWTLDPAIDAIVRPVVDSAYGAELNRLLAEGVRDVSTINATGLIGFPSFHTVMALMSLVAVWPYRLFRTVVLALNVALLPAILIHGGHNLMDLVGGALVTFVAWRMGLAVYRAQERQRTLVPGAAWVQA